MHIWKQGSLLPGINSYTGGGLGMIRRFQLPKDSAVPTFKISKRGHVWSSWQHRRRTQCDTIHTTKYQRPTSGRRWDKTLNVIKTTAYDANNERSLKSNGHRWQHFRFQTVQTSEFTPTFLAQCSQWTVTKKLSFASWMHLPSLLWSLRLPKSRLKWFLMPFTEIGLQNSGFQCKYTPTEARSSSINCQPNYFDCWMSDTQKPH